MLASKSIAVALAGTVMFGALTLAGAIPDKKTKAPAASAAVLAEGKKAYDANNCAACHLIGAKGGKTGPELTHIGKSKKPAELEAVIRDPKKSNPKALMPAYPADKIDAKKIKSLVAYLVSLK